MRVEETEPRQNLLNRHGSQAGPSLLRELATLPLTHLGLLQDRVFSAAFSTFDQVRVETSHWSRTVSILRSGWLMLLTISLLPYRHSSRQPLSGQFLPLAASLWHKGGINAGKGSIIGS